MKSLHLRIDRMVVEGLPEAGQRRFAGALERRLREMARSGLADEFTGNTRKRIAALDAGQLRPGATAEQAAAQVADSIRRSLGAPGNGMAASDQGNTRGGEARKHV
jgi:hypothetical protein